MARFQISSAAFWQKVRLSIFSGPCKGTDSLSFFFFLLRKWTMFSIDLTFNLNITSSTDLIFQYSSYLTFYVGKQFNPGPWLQIHHTERLQSLSFSGFNCTSNFHYIQQTCNTVITYNLGDWPGQSNFAWFLNGLQSWQKPVTAS